MAPLPLLQQDSADAELRDGTTDERASSSSSSEQEEARERVGAKRQANSAAATPPPRQQMDRDSSSSSSEEDEDEAAGPGRIPAEVFERDDHPAAEEEGNNKDWSMMSTDSVFGLQAAPSGDFTGFVLAHPELMDFDSTPAPRASTANADADATPFESIPELPETTMNGNHESFAFPNLIEDKRHSSPKKVQDEQSPATTTEAVPDEPTPAQAEAQQASSKPEAAQDNDVMALGRRLAGPVT